MKPKIDIDYVCALAHLQLTEEEKNQIAPQLKKIVEWVNRLEELDINASGGEVYSTVSFSAPFRKDDVQPSLLEEDVLTNAPEKAHKFIKVPKVIEEK